VQGLGFLSLAGESKIQLLPTAWPSSNLPPPTSSLMSVASQRGLIAAAGPDSIIIATTDSVRKAFQVPRSGDSEIRSFQPQLTIPMPMRISQVAFTSDENLLVLSAEVGGGIAVYDIQQLLNGATNSIFEMSTNSLPLRALIPNPTPEKAELLAIVTSDGKLMMANLKEKSYVSGTNGQILKEDVSCISWSTKGKQLVAGLGDGTAYQMTPEGVGKAEVPRPPAVGTHHHGRFHLGTSLHSKLTS
jgi:nucleoporin NUP159